MKKIWLPLLLILCTVLTACGTTPTWPTTAEESNALENKELATPNGWSDGPDNRVVVNQYYDTEEAVKNQLNSFKQCEVDEDCEVFYPWCPFGCYEVVNKQFIEQAIQLTTSYRDYQATLGNPVCEYDCMSIEDASLRCEQQDTSNFKKCVIIRG